MFLTNLNKVHKYDVFQYIMIIYIGNNNYQGTNKFNVFSCFKIKNDFVEGNNLGKNLFYTTSTCL